MFNLPLRIQIQSSSLSRSLDQNTVLWTFIPPYSHLQWITQIFSSNLPSQYLIQYSSHQLHQASPGKSHGNHMPFLSANQVPLHLSTPLQMQSNSLIPSSVAENLLQLPLTLCFDLHWVTHIFHFNLPYLDLSIYTSFQLQQEFPGNHQT